MRIAIITRGLPASGKTTFLKENRLYDYVVSPDDIREIYSGYELTSSGEKKISRKDEGHIWSLSMDILKKRMSNGELVIFDNITAKKDELYAFKNLCKRNRYKVVLVEFDDDVSTCINRDLKRGVKFVGANYISKINDEMKSWNPRLVKGIKVIKPHELKNEITYKYKNLDKYKKINHIGDIHGSYSILKKAYKTIKDDEFYIFHGDYIDRGPENIEMIRFIDKYKNYPNVVFLEGNHEYWMRVHLEGGKIVSPSYRKITKYQVESIDNWFLLLRRVTNSLKEVFAYEYNGSKVICCHGGIPIYTDNLNVISARDYIRGVKPYEGVETLAKTFEKQVAGRNIYQIFGHRSPKDERVKLNNNTFNLNGDPETGGVLKTLTLSTEKIGPKLNRDIYYKIGKHKNIFADQDVNIEERYISVSESLSNSIKEVKEIRNGDSIKLKLDDIYSNLD